VAAYGDGTIRWHRMQNGVELLAFMPLMKYVVPRVHALTGGRQNPGIEVRFEGTLCASGI